MLPFNLCQTKTARLSSGVSLGLLTPAGKPARPPSGATRRSFIRGLGGRQTGLCGWCMFWRADVNGRRGGLRVADEAHLFAHRRTPWRSLLTFVSSCLRRRACRVLRPTIGKLRFDGRRNRLRLDQRRRRCRGNSIEIGNRAFGLRGGRRRELVGDRAGEAVVHAATPPAASTAAPTAARPPLASAVLVSAGKAGLFVGFLLVGFAFLRCRAGDGLGLHASMVLARRAAFARFATTAATSASSASPALSLAVLLAVALDGFAGLEVFAETLGLVGLDLGFKLGLERFILVIGLFGHRR